jgi:integrase
LGEYGAMSLEDGRAKAREWHELIRKGSDPKVHEGEKRAIEITRQENTFATVAEEFIRLAVVGSDRERPKQRKGLVVERDIRREFIPAFGDRPISSINQHDIMRVLDAAVARGAEYQAHNLLGHVRRLFNWAISRGVYGIDRSPCDRMKPGDVIGKKALRTRVLNDDEMRAVWRSAEGMGYPFGPMVQLLMLSGQRKSEVSDARWREFDLEKKLWIIPAERMKGDAPHVVPIAETALAILKSLPTFKKGDYVFSTTFGAKPVSGFSKAKARLDTGAGVELREIRKTETTIESFVLHDLRRTMRTGLSGLPVPTDVAELVIAHARPGLRKVYDQHSFVDEKRRALELWEGRLRDIIQPPPANVVKLARA